MKRPNVGQREPPGEPALSRGRFRGAKRTPHLGAVVTDLDGTLLDAERRLPPANRQALQRLGELGVLRIIATGRSPFSLRRALSPDTPVDYVAFSSGAGIARWPDFHLMRATHLPATAPPQLAAVLTRLHLDFMLHEAIPDNHRFAYRRSGRCNPDFDRRLAAYPHCGRELGQHEVPEGQYCQALVIEPDDEEATRRQLVAAFPRYSIVMATSPLDGRSRWFEIFADGVCKSSAADWLLRREGRAAETVVAVGNDYNDADLLDWADLSFVVANAPESLRNRHAVVAAHDQGGFAEAMVRALASPRRPRT